MELEIMRCLAIGALRNEWDAGNWRKPWEKQLNGGLPITKFNSRVVRPAVEEFNRNPFNHPIWPFINSIVNGTFLNKWQFLVKFKMISLDLPVSWRVPLRVFTGI